MKHRYFRFLLTVTCLFACLSVFPQHSPHIIPPKVLTKTSKAGKNHLPSRESEHLLSAIAGTFSPIKKSRNSPTITPLSLSKDGKIRAKITESSSRKNEGGQAKIMAPLLSKDRESALKVIENLYPKAGESVAKVAEIPPYKGEEHAIKAVTSTPSKLEESNYKIVISHYEKKNESSAQAGQTLIYNRGKEGTSNVVENFPFKSRDNTIKTVENQNPTGERYIAKTTEILSSESRESSANVVVGANFEDTKSNNNITKRISSFFKEFSPPTEENLSENSVSKATSNAPLDSGLSVLLAAGVAVGLKKAYRKSRAKKNKME